MPPRTIERHLGAAVIGRAIESIDFTQEIDLLSFQSAKDRPILSDSGYVNFAALYLEVARQGPAKVLETILR